MIVRIKWNDRIAVADVDLLERVGRILRIHKREADGFDNEWWRDGDGPRMTNVMTLDTGTEHTYGGAWSGGPGAMPWDDDAIGKTLWQFDVDEYRIVDTVEILSAYGEWTPAT